MHPEFLKLLLSDCWQQTRMARFEASVVCPVSSGLKTMVKHFF